MTELYTLANISLDEIVDVFNSSFSDYFIPISVKKEQLQNRFIYENIALAYSVGAFNNKKLIGFILHFYDPINKIVYNGGTGVLKKYRGNGLTKEMYKYILPSLSKNNISKIQLEVLSQNEQATKSYKSVGFTEKRNLFCYSGEIDYRLSQYNDITFQKIDTYDWETLSSFWDFEPAWQNSIPVLNRMKNTTISLAAYNKNKLTGYIIFNPQSNRIHQIAVHKEIRNHGIGKSLVNELSNFCNGNISVINIDAESLQTNSFLKRIGLSHTLTQCELVIEPKNHS